MNHYLDMFQVKHIRLKHSNTDDKTKGASKEDTRFIRRDKKTLTNASRSLQAS